MVDERGAVPLRRRPETCHPEPVADRHRAVVAVVHDGVQALGPARTAVFINLVPVFAIALGATLLGETVDASMIVGGLIVVAGVWLLNRPIAPARVAVPIAG